MIRQLIGFAQDYYRKGNKNSIFFESNNKMNYQYLKTTQITIITLVAIYNNNFIALCLSTALCLTINDRFYASSILSTCICLIPFIHELIQMDIIYIIPFVVNSLICYLLKKCNAGQDSTISKKTTIFMILLGLTTMNGNSVSADIQLVIFFVVLLAHYLEMYQMMAVLVKILRIILIVQILGISIIKYGLLDQHYKHLVYNQSWWYQLSFVLSILYSTLIIHSSTTIQNQAKITQRSSSLISQDQTIEIQMKEISRRQAFMDQAELSDKSVSKPSLQQKQQPVSMYIIKKRSHENHQISQRSMKQSLDVEEPIILKSKQRQNILPLEKHNLEKNINTTSQPTFEQQQFESLNMILVIPFCLLKQSRLEVFIYAYLLGLQWGFSKRKWLFVIMMVCIGWITSDSQVPTLTGIVLRLLSVFLVTKDMKGSYQLAELIRIIWLRASFALVLSILFWYSLLTVNIFHLLFIAIILLFITTKNSKSQTHSYRHRNWKYLVFIFHIFLVMRMLYSITNMATSSTGESLKAILELTGISFKYSTQDELFNMVPLLINAILGLQYFTYNSKVYSIHSKSQMFQTYRTFLASLADIMTVIYYKLLPWASYLAILCLLLFLKFSLSTCILLGWALMTLGIHLLSKNEPSSYKRLHILWLIYARLTSLQIVLRYIFEFAKFDLLAIMRSIPTFQTLLRYQDLLGLAISDPEEVYLKTVTKFQLMVSLDLMAIFIAFIVTEYYILLIRYCELPPEESWQDEQRGISQVYKKYIDFKLTMWLKGFSFYKGIRIFCATYHELFYPLLGFYACTHYSLLMACYLFICLRYFLSLNYHYYHTHIYTNLSSSLIGIILKWKRHHIEAESQQLRNKLAILKALMQKKKVQMHNRLRKWLVLCTVLSVLLTYISSTLTNVQVIDIIGQQNIISIRWWLFVGGCNKEQGLVAHISKLILFLLVLEMKCCWFINKFQLNSKNYSPEQEEAIIKDIFASEQIEQEIDDNESNQQYFDGENWQLNSEYITVGEDGGVGQKEVNQIRISLLLGFVKLLERSFVMVLVFVSIVLGSHPFGIAYLLCAILLNYLGSLSIKVLSRMLSFLIIFEYLLILSNFTNANIFDMSQQFKTYQSETILHRLFGLNSQWQWYLTFGKNTRELAMLSITWILLVSYQLYFLALRKGWLSVLNLLQQEGSIGRIGKRMLEHIRQIYEYGLTYSPLMIMLLCLGIYLLDYTTTSMILTVLTVGFIFVSFMLMQYKDSRHFWRTYFIVLQLIIVFFMLIYSLLQLPMLSKYCNRFLCAPEELHTQIYKAMLLLILQLGLDLTSSFHFDRALKQLQKSKQKTDLQRLAIAYRHNDQKILQKFKQIRREGELIQTVKQVQNFIVEYQHDNLIEFGEKGQNYESKQSWIDVILQFLPSLIDGHLLLNQSEARDIVRQQNIRWMNKKGIGEDDLSHINDYYVDEYSEMEGQELETQLMNLLASMEFKRDSQKSKGNQLGKNHFDGDVNNFESKHPKIDDEHIYSHYGERKSFARQQLPLQPRQIMQSMRQSIHNHQEKEQLLYLLLAQSVISNWYYITYVILLLLHIRNQGLLTFPIPAVVFCCGLVASYQSGKQVWRWLILLVMLPLLFKYSVRVGLFNASDDLCYLLVGNNIDSILLQFLSIVFIIGQCIILKMIGHYQQSTLEIQCMKMALIRNILNHDKIQERLQFFKLLRKSTIIPTSFTQFVFGTAQCKPGYDYSTVLTSLQLIILIWVFLFYDRMAIRQEVTFYQMIQYNQFSSGMVALTLLQLLFLLGERFVAIADLKQVSSKWDIGLILKYIMLILNLLLVQGVVLLYFPLSSGRYQGNTYVTLLLILSLVGLLVQTLQIKKGLDQSSRGFMDRYTWYNGFVYIGYRAIPFLFQFKAFSDWTFTKTALRIFDWIRLEQIFGRLYVSKCNALFLSGKLLGSKIQWWKKLLMGYPLLLSIILLLFGPLVLFSSLNPLASVNDVTAGYLEVVLKINKTNEYPLYTNSHITDIHRLPPAEYNNKIIKTYDIDPVTVQVLHLQEFSDQYWEISEGSYYKLLAEPQGSLYELTVRAKFDRNQTGLTTLYVLSTYQVPIERVSDLKSSLIGEDAFCVNNLLPTFLRLDNNNGLHELSDDFGSACLKCTAGVRALKQYWVLQQGFRLKIASDKYTKAIFGYSVMSFYISIILVIANYFRFLFQGSVHTIITSDIPYPDPLLAMCNAIYKARRENDLIRQEQLFWKIIDLLRSPDGLKALTGSYLQARLNTLKDKEE